MRSITTSLAALSLLLCASAALAADAPATAQDGVLVDPTGMTLYTFDKDPAGASACAGDCAKNWPPLTAAAEAQPSGDFGLITRDDGSQQWTYKGKPLYYWAKDLKPGDRTGDGVKGVWHLAAP